jgi:hypothetical protein
VSEPSAATPAPPDRFLLAIVLGALALIVAGLAVVLALGRGPVAPPPDPASPVGVVQSYVEALRAGDVDRARAYLSQSARAELDRQRDAFPRLYQPAGLEERVLMEPVEADADHAVVKVTISTFSARTDPFSSSTYHREVEVRLVREAGQWRIAQPAEPYPFF